MGQLSFDGGDAERRKLEGMSKAERAARVQEWKRQANDWFENQRIGSLIRSDDLTRDVGLPDVGPNRNNVLGAWWSGKARQGLIVRVGFGKSERPERRGDQRIWRVL